MPDLALTVQQRDTLLETADMLAWLNFSAGQVLGMSRDEMSPGPAELNGYYLLASRCTEDMRRMLENLTTPPAPYTQGDSITA